MNEQERLYLILAEAILYARQQGTDLAKATESAALAFSAGVTAYRNSKPKVGSLSQLNESQRHRILTETAAAIDRIERHDRASAI